MTASELRDLRDWTVTVPYYDRRTRLLVRSTYGPYEELPEAADILRIFCQRWFGVGIPPEALEPSATAAGPAGPVTVRLSQLDRRAWGPRPLVLAAAEADE